MDSRREERMAGKIVIFDESGIRTTSYFLEQRIDLSLVAVTTQKI